ncbi:MAG: ABC transporter substrate-binding protein [Lachnospiraceae bacterium]|nr:ABC transporter substrate-binding protein [Lachnospiraceae bacterium]
MNMLRKVKKDGASPLLYGEVLICLLLCIFSFLTSCSWGGNESSDESQPATTKNTVTIGISSDVSTFDPFVDTLSNSHIVQYCIYQPLWQAEEDGTYTPILAEEWNWTDDIHLEVTLREGVTFSNGNSFTADDVVFSYERAMAGAFSQYFNKISEIQVTDDTHLTFVFSSVDATFMTYMGSSASFAILDRETLEDDSYELDKSPIGTGPYILAEWDEGERIVLQRNENYWGDAAVIENVIFLVVEDAEQRCIKLQTGDVDYAFELDYIDAISMDENDFSVDAMLSTMVIDLMFNSDADHKLADETLRQAIAFCIDREILVESLYGSSVLPAWSLVSPASIGYNEDLEGYEPYPQDFEKARDCLRKAGYSDGITLNLVYGDSDYWNDVVEILQNWFGQAGITLNIRQSDYNDALSYVLDRSNAWDIYLVGNGAATAPLVMSWWEESQGAPFAIFEDEGIFSLLEQVYQTTDESRQIELCNEAQKYMADHVGAYSLSVPYVCQGGTASLKGVITHPSEGGFLEVEKMYFE